MTLTISRCRVPASVISSDKQGTYLTSCEAFNPCAELMAGFFFKKRVPKIAVFHRIREADLSIYCINEGPKKGLV